MENIKHKDFTKEQDYLNSRSVDNCRTQLQIRLEMVDNFRSKYRTLDRGEEDRDPGLQYGDCGQSLISQSHCLVCPAWTEARGRLDLTRIEHLVVFYLTVLRGREEKEKKRRKAG